MALISGHDPHSGGFILSVLPALAKLRDRAQAGLSGCVWGQVEHLDGFYCNQSLSADLGQPSQGAV